MFPFSFHDRLLADFAQCANYLNGNLNIDFDPTAFAENLKYMGSGMLVIFVIIGIIILVTKSVSMKDKK